MREYLLRIADKLLEERLEGKGAVLIELLFQTCNTAFLMRKNGSEKINVAGNEGKIIDFFNSIGNERIS